MEAREPLPGGGPGVGDAEGPVASHLFRGAAVEGVDPGALGRPARPVPPLAPGPADRPAPVTERLPRVRIGADVGGTFTDVVLVDRQGRIWSHKLPSTPPAFERAVVDGIGHLLERSGHGGRPSAPPPTARRWRPAAVLEQRGARTVPDRAPPPVRGRADHRRGDLRRARDDLRAEPARRGHAPRPRQRRRHPGRGPADRGPRGARPAPGLRKHWPQRSRPRPRIGHTTSTAPARTP